MSKLAVWVNILSACNACAESVLPMLAESTGRLSVFSSVDNRFIGYTLRLEVRDRVDLWAELDLDDGVTPFLRAAAVLKKSPGGPIEILCVLATDLPRDAIHRLAYDMSN